MRLTYQQADWLMNHYGEDSVSWDGNDRPYSRPTTFYCPRCERVRPMREYGEFLHQSGNAISHVICKGCLHEK